MTKENLEKEYKLWMIKNPPRSGKMYSIRFLKFTTNLCRKYNPVMVNEFLVNEHKKGGKR